MSQSNKVSPAASSDREKQDDNGWRLTEAYRDSIVYQIFGTGAHYKHNYVQSVSRGAKYPQTQTPCDHNDFWGSVHCVDAYEGDAVKNGSEGGVRVCACQIYLWVFVTSV